MSSIDDNKDYCQEVKRECRNSAKRNRRPLFFFLSFALILIVVLLTALPVMAEKTQSGGQILDGRWLCSDVQGFVTEDTPAELKDDFALYVNKPWILQAQIPESGNSTTPLVDNALLVKDRQIALMKDETLTGHDTELVHKLYALASDREYRNAQGTKPVQPYLNAIAAIDSLDALMEYLRSGENVMRILPINVNVDADPLDPDTYITEISAQMLTMGDASEYTERTALGDYYYEESRQIALYMLQKLGYSEEEAAAKYDNAIAYEALLSAHILPITAHYEPGYYESTLNYFTQDELASLAGSFPIMDMLASIGMSGGKRFIVPEPDYIAGLQNVYIMIAGLIGLVYGVVEKAVLGNIAAVIVGLAIPMHIMWQFNQGGHWFEYEKTKSSRELFMATAVPFLFHGFWDSGLDLVSFLMDREPIAVQVSGGVLALALAVFGVVYSIRTVKKVCKIAREEKEISPEKLTKTYFRYCSSWDGDGSAPVRNRPPCCWETGVTFS